ncbi:MAG: TonB-dependent receptor plug domain-containing protein, partial [Gammaproteobacteria bacterium]|nr:TonB-dependent receptor plug domain-containing protein [Gammaproteobacteria bacterium]
MKAKLFISHLTFCLLSFLTMSLHAGTTGKIAGIVTDEETGDPLVGVNIVIDGFNLGAATDADGEYYILNIHPGVYTVKAFYIGYNTYVIEDVRIQVDLTTTVSFELGPSILESEEIVVTAKRAIQKDLTASEVSIQADQIEALPVRDVASLLTMQAGVTRDADGDLHIRGGRTTEISYMIDGIQVMNAVNRSAGISIDDQSIEELKAITGTFNAEYGQALSGVVNIVTKKGTDKFAVNATAYVGDHLSFDDDVYFIQNNRDWVVAAAEALSSKSGFVNYDFSEHGIESFQELFSAWDKKYKPWQQKESYLDSYNPFKNYDLQLNVSGPVPQTNNKVSYFIA